jgi:hypothetical protein
VDETTPSDLPASNRRSRWLLLLLGGVLLLLAAVVLVIRFVVGPSEQELLAALAEADRLDPGWHSEELRARLRREVPDEENSALLILAIGQVLRVGWNNKPLHEDLGKFAPTVQLDAQYTAALRAALAQYNDKLMQARRLADRPSGCFPADRLGGRPSPFISDLSNLLRWDAVLRAQDGDADGALESVRATLNAIRAEDAEPSFGKIYPRFSVRQTLQRTLAQGEPSETALAAAQRLMEEDASSEQLVLNGLRWLRAEEHEMLTQLARRKSAEFGLSPRGALAPIIGSIEVKHAHAWSIRFQTQLIEIAKLPPEQQYEVLEQLPPVPARLPFVIYSSPEMIDQVVSALRALADMRSTPVGLAAERYRRAQGHWPEALNELVPAYLPRVPLDPFTGKELSYRRLDDGVVVYSVGPSGKLRGQWAGPPIGVPGADKGFRLWDVDKRRQPSPPPGGGAMPRDK